MNHWLNRLLLLRASYKRHFFLNVYLCIKFELKMFLKILTFKIKKGIINNTWVRETVFQIKNHEFYLFILKHKNIKQ